VKDLNAAEIVELEGETVDFVQNRVLDGLACVVILVGRGHSYVGYPAEIADAVPGLLERAYLTARKHRARQSN